MNNGIISFAPSGTVDSRTLLGILPLNSNVLNSCSSPYNYPAPNNQYEGYYNRNDYVCVVDTTVNNNLTVTMGLVLAQGGFLTIDWGDGSYGGIVNSVNMQRNGSFETVFIVGGSSVFNLNHTYPRHGQYIVRFIGIAATSVASTRIGLTNSSQNVTHILSFGKNNGLTTCLIQNNTNLIYVPDSAPPQHSGNYGDNGGMFTGSSKFNHPNISKWNLNNNTSFGSMFLSCSSLNQSITGVVVNSGTSCANMFQYCSANNARFDNWTFNGNNACNAMFYQNINFVGNGLDSWTNTSSITNTNSMFTNNYAFNTSLESWNTSNITDMTSMFNGASAFNKSLNNWNVRKVTNFSTMFQSTASFNSSLSGWALGADVSGVNCTSMFYVATAFNQNLSSWDTSKVTNMNGMFYAATAFNNGGDSGISGWNTSNVTDMANMFNNNAFNQNIGSWDTSKVTSMVSMFQSNSVFNNGGSPSINNWNTNSLTNMQNMFWVARGFNQPIGNWNVSKVTSFTNCFSQAVAFDQNISGWNLAGINSIGGLDNFMLNKPYNGGVALSTANYDALLIGWNSNKSSGVNGVANWRTDLRPTFGAAKYTAGGAAATARAALVTYGWTITDGGSI